MRNKIFSHLVESTHLDIFKYCFVAKALHRIRPLTWNSQHPLSLPEIETLFPALGKLHLIGKYKRDPCHCPLLLLLSRFNCV